MKILRDELAATHEAGHAVIRNYFGMEIGELWINEGKGNCRFRVPDRGNDIDLLLDIAGSLAGAARQRITCAKLEANRSSC